MRVLILGGTTEATGLARLLAARPDIQATLSYAGRTSSLAPQPIPVRVGGFGGPAGLATYLDAERIDAVVDATHPFAERMSWNAVAASEQTGVPLVALARPPWAPVPGDRWTEVDDLAAAATAFGERPRRVLLTVGRLGLKAFEAAPQHHYLVRSIDPPQDFRLPDARVILDRPPFDRASERALMQGEAVDVLVTKNAGSAATYAKIEAARELGIEVVIVRPPIRPDVATVADPEAALAWLDAHARRPADRGE